MRLLRVRLASIGPFDDLVVSFGSDEAPRPVTVILGGGGTGKTSLLAAIASTRPGFAVAQPRRRGRNDVPFVVAEWVLGRDDPARPHPLIVTGPNAVLDEAEDAALLRRREQALFDKRAADGGFFLTAISAARWFSRTPVLLSSPERTIARWDPKTPPSFDDATRADLARETKQAIVYPLVAAALDPSSSLLGARARAVKSAVDALAGLAGWLLRGVDPTTLEPLFARENGDVRAFDDLEAAARHLVAIAALAVRGVTAAYGDGDPIEHEGVVLVDEIAAHQEAAVARKIVPALHAALPNVQWIVTTSSPEVLAECDADAVIALRRSSDAKKVELFEGPSAFVH